jgi:hypothetical protein
MTAGSAVMHIKGKGVLFIEHTVKWKGKSRKVTSRLTVYWIPGLSLRLLSIVALLNNGFELRGSSSSLDFRAQHSVWPLVQCIPHIPGQNLYWLTARLACAQSLLALSSVPTVDYDIMHRRFAHPSKDVLRHASGNTQNFPSNLHSLRLILYVKSSLCCHIIDTSSLSCSLTIAPHMVGSLCLDVSRKQIRQSGNLLLWSRCSSMRSSMNSWLMLGVNSIK